MRKFLLALFVATSLLLAAPAASAEPTAEGGVENVEPFPVFSKLVVRVFVVYPDGSMSAGTGFITTDGVFTAWHVLDAHPNYGPALVSVIMWDGEDHDVTKWDRVFNEDVVKLTVPTLKVKSALVLADGEQTKDAPCNIIGYWGVSINYGFQVLSMGRLLLRHEHHAFFDTCGETFYCTSMMVGPGCSGGPVFVNGRVVGLLTGAGGDMSVIARLDRQHLKDRAALLAEAVKSEPVEDDQPVRERYSPLRPALMPLEWKIL